MSSVVTRGAPARRIESSACAKVNFGLRITGRRDDGYHLLDSVFVPLTLADHLAVEVRDEPASGATVSVSVAGEASRGVPAGAENLAARAAANFVAAAGLTCGVSIALEKRVPSAAGLGGGSSDAAAVLRALADLYPKAIGSDRLAQLALELGADVPFFLAPQPARVTGIGERIEPLGNLPACALVLANSGDSLSTAAVYGGYDARRGALTQTAPGSTMPALSGTPDQVSPRPIGAPQRGLPNFADRLDRLLATRVPDESFFENDLEPAAASLCPAISSLRARLSVLGALATGMSGSGATVFGLFAEERAASEASEELQRSGLSERAGGAWARVANTLASR